jgi:hypothetical protein
MSEQAIKAQQQVQRIRRGIVDQPTYTERDVDRRLEELAEAELTARLARSAAWRA